MMLEVIPSYGQMKLGFIGFNALRNTVEDFDLEEALFHPYHQILANREYSWGFTLVPIRSVNQVNEVTKYDY